MLTHKGTTELRTERVVLRRFTLDDASDVFENWANDDEVTKYLTWPTHSDSSITKLVLQDWISKYENPNFYNWAIELKEEKKVIGNISVVDLYEEADYASLGWCMGRAWWGKAIMPEAARAVLKYLFEECNFNRIDAEHDIANPKSGRVMQKIGMTYEGIKRQGGRNNQGIVDLAVYSVLRKEYERRI